MRYVYVIRSVRYPGKYYTGLTRNFTSRLRQHDAGEVTSTRPYKPWKPVVVIRFEDDQRAIEFERYLKSGSGQAFAHRHLF